MHKEMIKKSASTECAVLMSPAEKYRAAEKSGDQNMAMGKMLSEYFVLTNEWPVCRWPGFIAGLDNPFQLP
jgi:hypothetical protein